MIGVVLGVDRLTVKMAKPPSTTVVSDTLMFAVSSSTIVVPTVLATPLIARFSKLPPVAVTSATLKVSAPSASASLIVATLKVVLPLPAGIVTLATPA